MTRVACAGADMVWATSDNPRTEPQSNIFKDMRKGMSKGSDIHLSKIVESNKFGVGRRK